MLAASSLELVVRMGISLIVVGVLMAVALKASRSRTGMVMSKAGLSVCSRRQLTRSASVMVLRAGERHLLVAVNDQSVTLLAEGDDLAPAEDPAVDDQQERTPQFIDALLAKVLTRNQ